MNPYAAFTDPGTGEVDSPPHAAISYAGCVAEVEVDDVTGEVRVTSLTQSYEVDKAIDPSLVEGHIQGGAIMGLGLGVLKTSYPNYPSVEHRGSRFGFYYAPSPPDMPELETIIIENPSEDSPYGTKGIGEMANNSQPAAIATAVYNAIGGLDHRVADHTRCSAKGPGQESRRRGPASQGRQDGDLRQGHLGQHRRRRTAVGRLTKT